MTWGRIFLIGLVVFIVLMAVGIYTGVVTWHADYSYTYNGITHRYNYGDEKKNH